MQVKCNEFGNVIWLLVRSTFILLYVALCLCTLLFYVVFSTIENFEIGFETINTYLILFGFDIGRCFNISFIDCLIVDVEIFSLHLNACIHLRSKPNRTVHETNFENLYIDS